MKDVHADAARRIREADAVVVGAGAGLSAAAGMTYSGERFKKHFADFIARYHFTDLYTAGFYPFPTPEEYWAYWSRHIYYNRYDQPVGQPYKDLLELLRGRDYFVLTTNVDHRFQLAGFDKRRLFYTQGDYGLWQCAKPCHSKTYDNEPAVRLMLERQENLRIPSALVPRCPVCGGPMAMNLRIDDTFVEDDGWRDAASRYACFLGAHEKGRVVYLELGVGGNTPGIVKYPFWRMTRRNPQAAFICVNRGEAMAPAGIAPRALCIDEDLAMALAAILREEEAAEHDA